MAQTYPSRVDWWMYPALILPVAGGAAALVGGLASGEATVLYIGAGALVFYLLVLWGLVLPMRYAIGDDGLRVRAGRMKLHVPFDRLIKAELSRNPLSSPALSLSRISVEYRKPSGKETYVLISPPDRERFLADLAAASPRHRLVDGNVLET